MDATSQVMPIFTKEQSVFNGQPGGQLFNGATSGLDAADEGSLSVLWNSGQSSTGAADTSALNELAGSHDYIAREVASEYKSADYSSETIRDGLFALDHTQGVASSDAATNAGILSDIDFTLEDPNTDVTSTQKSDLAGWYLPNHLTNELKNPTGL